MSSNAELLAPPIPAAGQSLRWGQLYGPAAALSLAAAAARLRGPLVICVADMAAQEALEDALRFFAPADLPVHAYVDWETLPYDHFSPYQEIVSRRLKLLHQLPELGSGIVLVTANSLLTRLPPPGYVAAHSFWFELGESVDLDALRTQLADGGYRRVGEVLEAGDYAIRGSLVDVFPMGSDTPFRLDLFDAEIDSIRSFDPTTQRSLGKLERIHIMPAREFPLDAAGIRRFRQNYRRRFAGDPMGARLYREVSDGIAGGGVEYYLPLFFEATGSLPDYLPATATIAEFTGARAEYAAHWSQVEERHAERCLVPEEPVLDPAEIFIPVDELDGRLAEFSCLTLGSFEAEASQAEQVCNFGTRSTPGLALQPKATDPAAALKQFVTDFQGRVLMLAESAGRREVLLDTLTGHNLRPTPVADWQEFVAGDLPLAISVAPLDGGFASDELGIALLSESQLLGSKVKQRKRRRAERDPDAIIRDLTDLVVGAPVVHEDYGVGRYLGLITLEAGGVSGEFLHLEYADEATLYVPVHALERISRYTGASPDAAPLHRLGTDQWEKAKRKAAKRIRDAAVELLDIHARRAAREGYSFSLDEAELRGFAAGFPYEPTPDQAAAITDVLEDLRSPQPSDRIVCGDVGFGKTEVALRAAFVGVMGGKQVAVLVPTTLLAQQHGQSFQDRFADWPVRVEVLSRFRTRAEITTVLADLAVGKVDIVIGTHRLLQKDVKFHDLGLVVVDEEQRFGVRHKEQLKSWRSEVDILTLTATPIPRTLNMAMGGLRELSLITTPPAERLAVKTFVSEWREGLIREACLREIKRGGQVYFLHNSVQTMEKMAAQLRKLLPEATIAVGHGQMGERELEQVMLDFYHRRCNLLLCTTIIESGLDVPSANTIIINRADKFGLAQLHQLRGRVGRSHHRAYAYLITPPLNTLTTDAVKRLEAIESLEELGAGFSLATHDLEIRGAGELLGDEQSGQIHEIGYTLYIELLERTVRELKAGRDPDLEKPLHHGPEIDLRVAALLPEYFLPDVHMRLVLYKRISAAADDEVLRELQVEMIDRFGLLPDPAKALFELAELRIRAARLGIIKLDAGAGGGRVKFGPDTPVEPLTLVKMVQTDPKVYRLAGADSLRFDLNLEQRDKRFTFVRQLLEQLRGPGS